MYLIAISVIPYSLMSFNAESLKGLKRITAFSLHQNISIYFGGMLILMILSCFTPSVIAIWWSLLIIFILLMITSGFTFRYFLKFLPNRDSHYSRPVPGIKQIIRITLPMMLSNSLFLLMNWTDVLMLAYIQGDDQVGIYNTALKIAALNSLVLIAVNSIAMPKYSELYNQNKLRFKQLAKAVSFISFFVSLPVFLMIIIFPTTILGLFGEAFTEGSQAMIVLSVGQLFATISGSTINLLNMTGKEKSTMYILITSVIVNFFLNFILIPLFGFNGAAYATASSTVLWNLLAVVLIYKYHGFLTYPIINPAKIKYYFNIFFS
jgi:O-antigen/teichoic acid export membrane protein